MGKVCSEDRATDAGDSSRAPACVGRISVSSRQVATVLVRKVDAVAPRGRAVDAASSDVSLRSGRGKREAGGVSTSLRRTVPCHNRASLNQIRAQAARNVSGLGSTANAFDYKHSTRY